MSTLTACVAQLDRASVFETEGCRFEPRRARLIHPAVRACILAVEESLHATESDADLATLVTRLSDLYTSDRGALVRDQGSAGHLVAKCGYFLASDAPKIALALDRGAERSALIRRLTTLPLIRVTDFGAGVGATSIGFLAWLAAARATNAGAKPASVRVEFHAIELGAAAARAYEQNVRIAAAHCGFEVAIRLEARDFFDCPAQDTDLILSQTALNELLDGPTHATRTIDLVHAWSTTAPMLLIEPALKTTTRALMQLRDALLSRGGMHAIAPCLHQLPCPMLPRAGDWCHEARFIDHTPRVRAIDRIVKRRDERALFAYLLTAPGPASEPSTSTPVVMRLCTDTLGSRGKSERLVCRSDGEMRMMRLLDREARDSNQPFLKAKRGDMIEVDPLPANDRITPEARVTISALQNSV